MVELVRLSGYRLRNLSAEQMAYRWAALRAEVQKYVPLFQQMDFGYYLDDGDKAVPILELLMSKLQSGEMYLVYWRKDFVGVAAITNIAYGRNAYIEAIAIPKYHKSLAVGKAFGELLTYAFNDYSDSGLGLKKLKATVVAENMQVIKMLGKAGFNPAGVLQGESLHMGVPHAMILLEYLNPKFFSVDTKVISNERSAVQSRLQPDRLREPTATSTIPISDGERTPSTDATTDRTGGAELRVDTATVAPVEQLQWDAESFESGGPGWTVRPESDQPDVPMVHAEPSQSPSVAVVSTEPKSRRRVRK